MKGEKFGLSVIARTLLFLMGSLLTTCLLALGNLFKLQSVVLKKLGGRFSQSQNPGYKTSTKPTKY